jgi:hypothetical protein
LSPRRILPSFLLQPHQTFSFLEVFARAQMVGWSYQRGGRVMSIFEQFAEFNIINSTEGLITRSDPFSKQLFEILVIPGFLRVEAQ